MADPVDFHSDSFFLTYPRTDLDLDSAVLTVLNKVAETTKVDLLYYAIARELHEDDYPHLHVLLTFDHRVRIRNVHAFDIVDYTLEERHCNIQISPGRGKKQWIADKLDYIRKDGNFESTYPSDYAAANKSKWQLIEEEGEGKSVDEFMQLVRHHDPRAFYQFGEQIRRNRESTVRYDLPSSYRFSEFDTPEELMDWYVGNFLVRSLPCRPQLTLTARSATRSAC